jgi:SRSO17 transposase
MLDESQAWGLPQAVVVADAAYGVVTEFRRGLQKRRCHYVLGITADLTVWTEPVTAQTPTYGGRGRPPRRDRTLPKPLKVAEVARGLPDNAWQEISWREGTKGPLRGRFAALRVQPAHGYHQGKVTEPMVWLLIEWPTKADAPEDFWFSNLPEDTDLQELVYWAKIRWYVEQNYQQLKDELGLDHFEGRSWNGWHRHVTLTMMAFAFLVLEGFRAKKNFWVDLAPGQAGTAAPDFAATWFLPELLPSIHN